MSDPPEDPARKLKEDGAKELLTIDRKLATITVTPNGAEGKDSNFPRNLHNAAELFLKVGMAANAKRLHGATTNLFEWYEKGPDGRTTLSMGRGCICWNCGYVGLPKNADVVHKTNVTPAGVCGNCGENDQTNFVRPTKNSKDDEEMPWMQLKAKAPDAAPAADARAPSGSLQAGGSSGSSGSASGGGGGAAEAKDGMKKISSPCGNCGKDGTLQCARCKTVRYCSGTCQKTHWKKGGHKAACKPAK